MMNKAMDIEKPPTDEQDRVLVSACYIILFLLSFRITPFGFISRYEPNLVSGVNTNQSVNT